VRISYILSVKIHKYELNGKFSWIVTYFDAIFTCNSLEEAAFLAEKFLQLL